MDFDTLLIFLIFDKAAFTALLWLAIYLLVILIALMALERREKPVVVPSVTVATDKAEYAREEVVKITGKVTENGEDQADTEVIIAVDEEDLEPVTTDATGDYSVEWPVPADIAGGTHTVTATALGTKATTTFTSLLSTSILRGKGRNR